MTPLYVQGQNIRINVSDNDGALPYSHIFINKEFATVTNDSGIADIPVSKLNYGDTITSTYIGMHPAFLVYSQQVEQSGECWLVHMEQDIYAIESVSVIGYGKKDSRKIFRKFVKPYPQLLQNCIVTAHFTGRITLPNGTDRSVDGSFTLKNNIPKNVSNRDFAKSYFSSLPEIATDNDTTRVGSELLTSIMYGYRMACNIIGQLNIEHTATQSYSHLRYLGVKDNKRFFRYTNSNPRYLNGVQILFDTNIDTQELGTIEYTTTSRSGEYATVNIKAYSRKIPAPSGKRQSEINIPEDIVVIITHTNGIVTDMKIDNITIRFTD